METMSGIATDVMHGATVSGNGGQEGSTPVTVHTTLLRLGGVQVQLTGATPAPIRNGDRLVLAGRRNGNGVFVGLAYRNESTGVTGSEGWKARFAVCGAMLLIGVSFARQALPLAGSGAAVFVAAWCGLVGWQLVRAVQVLRAERLLQGA